MTGHDAERLHERIDPKLATLARDLPSPPGWFESWSCLDRKATLEDRLWVCRLIRDSGTLPDDAGYFLISWIVEQIAEREMDRPWHPLETVNLFESCRTSERLFAQLLQQHGEGEMGHCFVTDRSLHDRRREAGRVFFFDPPEPHVPPDPRWLESFLRLVAGSIVLTHPVGKLDHRLTNESDWRDIQVFLPGDQAWAINVDALQEGFEEVHSLGWYGVPPAANESPYLWLHGEYLKQEVFLRISGRPGAGS
jgi:hypothetical protein